MNRTPVVHLLTLTPSQLQIMLYLLHKYSRTVYEDTTYRKASLRGLQHKLYLLEARDRARADHSP